MLEQLLKVACTPKERTQARTSMSADAFDADTLRELHAIARDNAECPSELRLRVAVGLPRLGSFTRAHALISELARAGVDEVHLLVKPDERHRRFAEAVERELGIQVLLPKV